MLVKSIKLRGDTRQIWLNFCVYFIAFTFVVALAPSVFLKILSRARNGFIFMMTKKNSLLDTALELIRQGSCGSPYASRAELARAAHVSEVNLSRWLGGTSTPTLKKLEPVLTALGVTLQLPEGLCAQENMQQPGSIPTTKVAPVYSPPINIISYADTFKIPTLTTTDFILVPFLGEPGKTLSTFEAVSWVPLPHSFAQPNMFMLRVPQKDRAMEPTLFPGDILLLEPAPQRLLAGDIYLVQEPPTHGGAFAIRRVRIQRTSKGQSLVIIYADNAQGGHSPIVHPIEQYDEEAFHRIVHGRVTWVCGRPFARGS